MLHYLYTQSIMVWGPGAHLIKGPWWGPGANPQWVEPPEAAGFFGYGELSFDIFLYISQVANAL